MKQPQAPLEHELILIAYTVEHTAYRPLTDDIILSSWNEHATERKGTPSDLNIRPLDELQLQREASKEDHDDRRADALARGREQHLARLEGKAARAGGGCRWCGFSAPSVGAQPAHGLDVRDPHLELEAHADQRLRRSWSRWAATCRCQSRP